MPKKPCLILPASVPEFGGRPPTRPPKSIPTVPTNPQISLCAGRTGFNSVIWGLTGTLGYPATYLSPLAALRRF